MNFPIIDAWTASSKFFRLMPEVTRLLIQSGQSGALKFAQENPDWKISPQELLTSMDAAGVDKLFLDLVQA